MRKVFFKSLSLFLIIPLLSFFLVSCDEKSESALSALSQEEQKEAFLSYKQISTKNSEIANRSFDSFLSREKAANSINSKTLITDAELTVALADFKHELIINRYFEDFFEKNMTDKNVRDFYQNNLEKYTKPQVLIAKARIYVNPNISNNEKNTTKKMVEQLRQALINNKSAQELKQQFPKLNLNLSAWFTPVWIDAENLQPLASLWDSNNKNTVSQILEADSGFSIFKVVEGPKERTLEFTEVEQVVRAQMTKALKESEMTRLKLK